MWTVNRQELTTKKQSPQIQNNAVRWKNERTKNILPTEQQPILCCFFFFVVFFHFHAHGSQAECVCVHLKFPFRSIFACDCIFELIQKCILRAQNFVFHSIFVVVDLILLLSQIQIIFRDLGEITNSNNKIWINEIHSYISIFHSSSFLFSFFLLDFSC